MKSLKRNGYLCLRIFCVAGSILLMLCPWSIGTTWASYEGNKNHAFFSYLMFDGLFIPTIVTFLFAVVSLLLLTVKKEGSFILLMPRGVIALIYEDESGQEYREEQSFRTDIGRIVIEPETAPET